eukprot:m.195535 g.195535  ORF g.195535 m.195535 type:complete len:314 (-) comp15691_c0_seq26:83-1024(-)
MQSLDAVHKSTKRTKKKKKFKSEKTIPTNEGKRQRLEPVSQATSRKKKATCFMGERYWDSKAKNYDKEIYDSYNDAVDNSAITAILERFADRDSSCIDFGCGVGKYLPPLASRFHHVHGIDISQGLLHTAMEKVVWKGSGRSRSRVLKNVTLVQADITQPLQGLSPASFGICTNVLLLPDSDKINAMLNNIRNHILPGGHVMFLVPSLESALFVGQMFPKEMRKQLDTFEGHDIMLGRLPREGVLTQYFIREHFQVLLRHHGFDMESSEKLEYRWTHEFGIEPPHQTGAGDSKTLFPWDWLVLAQRCVDNNES